MGTPPDPAESRLKPQAQIVARHLREHGSITPKEARAYGIDRLAARVLELRRSGWIIETHYESHNGGRHARYRIGV